jgi:hypothetical protein
MRWKSRDLVEIKRSVYILNPRQSIELVANQSKPQKIPNKYREMTRTSQLNHDFCTTATIPCRLQHGRLRNRTRSITSTIARPYIQSIIADEIHRCNPIVAEEVARRIIEEEEMKAEEERKKGRREEMGRRTGKSSEKVRGGIPSVS